jgi:Polyketide cyclase / dehydrase and lipid transport
MDGDTRVCAMADGSQIHEQITDHDDQRRSYRFRHLRTPLPVRHLQGGFAVADTGGGAIVTLDTDLEPADPGRADQVTAMIQEAFGQALGSLRRYVESGQRWDTA